MKKVLKRLMAFSLAAVMMLAMSVTALAVDPTFSITVTNSNKAVSINGKEYTAYKIFEATYVADSDKIAYTYDADTCLNIKYPTDEDVQDSKKSGEALIAWLSETKEENGQTVSARTASEVRAFADYVYQTYIKDKTVDGSKKKSATASDESATIDLSDLGAGYYLVYGTASATDGSSEVTAAVTLTSVHPTEVVAPKLDAPSLTKQIKHNELVTDAWGVVGDNQIGDTVDFRIITTVPDINGYSSYTYTIHDTISDGLSLKQTGSNVVDITIKVNDEDGNGTTLNSQYYDVEAGSESPTACSFHVKVKIKEAIAASVLKNNDKLYISYSAMLNKDAAMYDGTTDKNEQNEAWLEYSNSPYATTTGTTEKDTVYDWTFSMGINKIDKDNNNLTGAKFVLSKSNDLNLENLKLTDVGEVGTDAVSTEVDKLVELIAGTDGTYTIVPSRTSNTTYVMTAGNITIKGLDAATTYYLYETKAPDGYNRLKDPVSFNIAASYSTDGASLETGKPTVTVGTGQASTTLSTNVVNNSGLELPSTGGMGTKLFYVIGGILVLVAVVLLVTKRRMSARK